MMYWWNLDTQQYLNTLDSILDCGLKNNIEGSKFANKAYISNTWNPIRDSYQEIFDILDYWWHPMMHLGFSAIPVIGETAMTIANVVMMLEYQETAN